MSSPMPRPTPRNTPNRSSDDSRTFPTAMLQIPHWFTMGHLILPSKLPPLHGPIPKSTTSFIPGPIQPTIPNRMHILRFRHTLTDIWRVKNCVIIIIITSDRPCCHNALDRHTHRPTNGCRECVMTMGRYHSIESDDAA